MIPLLHDFAGETVLVFGGGSVGARKARRFAREARVVVVSPSFADADFGDAERVRAAPTSDGVAGWVERTTPALVVAATDDPALNAAAASAARERGALVNRADRSGDRAPGSVVVPATVREDPVVVAVATGGTSPALSRYLRERLEADLDGAGAMATLLGDLREDLSEWPAARRHEALRRVVRDECIWKALGRGNTNARQLADDIVSTVGDSE